MNNIVWRGCALVLICAPAALAGNGTILKGDPANPNDCAGAPCGPDQRAGDISLDINVRFIPSGDDIDRIKEIMTEANQIVCDASDGGLRLRNIRITRSDGFSAAGDIWWFKQPLNGGFPNSVGWFGKAGGRVALFDVSTDPATVAHELGHLIFGLSESYNAQHYPPWGACGIGPNFDTQPIANAPFWLRLPSESPLFSPIFPGHPSSDTSRGNSIMDSIDRRRVCRDSNGLAPFQIDPVEWSDGISNRFCKQDADCMGTFPICSKVPKIQNELSSVINFDAFVGTFDTGGAVGSKTCPMRPARELVFWGRLNPRLTSTCGIDADGDGRLLDSNEECDGGNGGHTCQTLGSLRCGHCVFDTSSCQPAAGGVCGDGIKQAEEDCDDPSFAAPCSSLRTTRSTNPTKGKPLTGGVVRCTSLCTYDFTECGVADGGTVAPPTDLNGFKNGFKTTLTFFDSLGDITLDGGKSRHEISAFARRVAANQWLVVLAMDAADFGGKKGDYNQIAAYALLFDAAGRLSSINGQPYDVNAPTANPPVIVLGSPSDFRPMGTAWPGFPGGQTGPTGAFASGASAQELTLRFEELREISYEDVHGSTGSSFFKAEARYGTVSAGVFAGKPIPQTGSCANEHICGLGWNSETEQYETSQQALVAFANAINAGATYAQVKQNPRNFLTSEWDSFVKLMNERGVAIGLPPNGEARPEALIAPCLDPNFTVEGINTPKQIVLALDRSYSMVAPSGQDARATRRLDFVKASARAFVDSFVSLGPEIGLVWFNDAITEPMGTSLRKLVSAAPNAQEVDVKEVKKYLRDSADSSGENPTPAGFTAIGQALERSGQLLPQATVQQAVLLLTDGAETAWPSTPGSINPINAAGALAERGIEVYMVPASSDADAEAATLIASTTQGQVLDANDITEAPGAFFEAFAAQQGQQLARHQRAPERLEKRRAGEFHNLVWVRDLEVESGAISLDILVWSRITNVSTDPTKSDWKPTVHVTGPNAEAPSPIVMDPYYQLFRIPNPAPGTWRVDTYAGQTSDPGPPDPNTTARDTWVAAFINNPGKKCEAEFQSRIVADGQKVRLSAQVTDQLSLRDGAVVTASIQRPDRTALSLSLPYDMLTQSYTVDLPQSELRGRGLYEATIRCAVPSGTPLAIGEVALGGGAIPSQMDVSAGFIRETSAQFFYDSATQPPLPSGDDCDGDGIVNSNEPGGDLDRDGIDDVCDGDADNDDVHDSADPSIALECRPSANCIGATKECSGALTPVETGCFGPLGCTVTSNAASAYPLGNHKFQCTSSDASGKQAEVECSVIVQDTIKPQLAGAALVRVSVCNPDPHVITLPLPSATDTCSGAPQISGEVIAIREQTLAKPIPIGPNGEAVLPTGNVVVRWTATDASGNQAELQQIYEVSAEESAICCAPDQILIEGSDLQDFVVATAGSAYCVIAKGAPDFVLTADHNDVIVGGTDPDHLNGNGGRDVLFGGGGVDMLNCGPSGYMEAHGGDGDDFLQALRCDSAELWGGRGSDTLTGSNGSDRIYPGTGRDSVAAGPGDDEVTLFGSCEAESGKVLDGGEGYDTLVAPISEAGLSALGVSIIGFENIVVDSSRAYLAECF